MAGERKELLAECKACGRETLAYDIWYYFKLSYSISCTYTQIKILTELHSLEICWWRQGIFYMNRRVEVTLCDIKILFTFIILIIYRHKHQGCLSFQALEHRQFVLQAICSNFGGCCVKNQIQYCHQVALTYQLCSNNKDLYQSIGSTHEWS